MAVLVVVTMLSGMASSADIANSSVILTDPIAIHTRPPLEIHQAYLCEEQTTPGVVPSSNLTGTQIDVNANYSFYFNISDRDDIGSPNSSNIMGVGFVGYVSFEGDPGVDPSNAVSYDKTNYEFFIFANRTGGGGNQSTTWDVMTGWSNWSSYDNETRVFLSNSSLVADSDQYNATGAPGTDGVFDTVAFRMQFRLGAQIRNTNATGNNSDDCWYYYAAAYDLGGGCNTSKDWNLTFDVYQYTKIAGFGKVAGGGFPGGGGFRLSAGQDKYHTVGYAANNNCTFYVNATNFTSGWNADTLKFNGQNEPIGSPNWTQIGPENTTVAHARHALNATGSRMNPQPGENGDGRAYWMCTGIPSGVASGVYNSTVTFRIYIDGTTGPA
jgi:hypothetical protein